jgi:hypothetical protein
MDEALHALVYEAHPYRWPVIGWMGDIEAIRREDCEAYFRTFYAPNNATLWVAGHFEAGARPQGNPEGHTATSPRGPPVPGVSLRAPATR